jgi:subtilisin family serine protease
VLLRYALIAASAGALMAPAGAAANGHDLLVRYEDAADAGDRRDVRRDAGVIRQESLGVDRLERVRARSSAAAEAAVEHLERDPRVLYAEPELPRTATQDRAGAASSIVQWALTQINVPAAWGLTVGSNQNVVAVIDSGVELSHPDLVGRLIAGWDFVDDDASPEDETPVGHGTHVAGVIGASAGNDAGVAGIDWTSQILPLRVLDAAGRGTVTTEVKAIAHAAAAGAKVANLSLAGAGFSHAERDALAAAEDTLFVVAAGNDSADVDVTGAYPCAYELSNVICVTSSDQSGRLAPRANRGARSVDLAAPGVDIVSTIRGGQYGYLSGTSTATPHVSGAAALMAAREPAARPEDLARALLETTEPLPAFAGKTVTGGLLDVAAAVDAVRATPKPPEPTPTPPVTEVPISEDPWTPSESDSRARPNTDLVVQKRDRDSARLRVRRSRVRAGRLEVLASIDRRARGSVQILYRAGKRSVRMKATIASGQVRLKHKLPAHSRATLGTVTVTWAGSTLLAPAKQQRRATR